MTEGIAAAQPLIVRADADTAIGAGHVMRSLALAQEWRARGRTVTFLTTAGGDIRTRLQSEGFRVLAPAAVHPDPGDLASLADVVAGAAHEPWIALDGYHFDAGYHNAARDCGARLLVVDDDNHLPAYDADIVLNQNLGAESIQYRVSDGAQLLRGTAYALLRDEFLRAGTRGRKPRRARRLLVTFGAADRDNVSGLVMEAILRLSPELRADVVVGPANPNLRELRPVAHSLGDRVTLIESAPDMPRLMAAADLAVSAGGSTCWELAYMAVPALLIACADNQVAVARGLDRVGAGRYLGRHTELDIADLCAAIETTVHDPAFLSSAAERARALVDGRGRARVADTMAGFSAGK